MCMWSWVCGRRRGANGVVSHDRSPPPIVLNYGGMIVFGQGRELPEFVSLVVGIVLPDPLYDEVVGLFKGVPWWSCRRVSPSCLDFWSELSESCYELLSNPSTMEFYY